MHNPGDVPAWPIWTVHGPFTELTLTVDGHITTWPAASGAFPAGTGLVIDTNPEDQRVLDMHSGNDFTRWMRVADFAPISAGDSVEVGIAMTGTGYVSCQLRPRYLRAW